MLAPDRALIYAEGRVFARIPGVWAIPDMEQEDEGRGSRRKRRTREHIIEDLSENYLERMVLLRGHILRRPARDYGVDVTMFHFAEDGRIENGEVRFQLKATENPNIINDGTTLSIPILIADLDYWAKDAYPFILVVFDALHEKAFWLDVKKYVRGNPGVTDGVKKTLNVHIPVLNALTVETIDVFRQRSLETIEWLREQGGLPDVRKKPR